MHQIDHVGDCEWETLTSHGYYTRGLHRVIHQIVMQCEADSRDYCIHQIHSGYYIAFGRILDRTLSLLAHFLITVLLLLFYEPAFFTIQGGLPCVLLYIPNFHRA